MNTYYVWQDLLLEELFALEKIEMAKYNELKTTLEREKIVLVKIEADSIPSAIVRYREKVNQVNPIKKTFH